MKTVRQWAEHLPDPIRNEFLVNWTATGYDIDELKFDSLADAIRGDETSWFEWKQTLQKFDYWKNIHEQALSGRFDIPPHIQAATIADDEQPD